MGKKKFSENELVTRTYNVELRASDEETDGKGIIEGVPIVFNQDTHISTWSGDFIERIDAHALDEADLKDVRLFINHDTGKIALARSKNGKGTMSMEIKEDGLHIRAALDVENNQEARSLHSAIKRGDMDGMSFMFRIKDQEWLNLESETPTRVVKKISIVHEVSVVNFPAYQGTSINARSSSEETEYSPLEEAREARAKEIAKKKENELEIEKLKINYLLNLK